MIFKSHSNYSSILFILFSLLSPTSQSESNTEDSHQLASQAFWESNIKPAFFSGKDIIPDNAHELIKLNAPFKAEDPSIVPISIKINTNNNINIKNLYIFIDKNPSPLVGILEFPVSNSKTDVAMRVRVNDFSYIRAVAESTDGDLYMTKSFVKAAGGCSAPAGTGPVEFIGKMKTRLMGKLKLSEPNLLQLKIRHPNYSGLEMPLPGQKKPEPYYINNLKVRMNDELVLNAVLTFSISTNPSFRFYITPEKEGLLDIEATDTKNNVFTHSHILDHNNVSINKIP
jgi:sulfur-oxidizing protein SoxY